MSRIRPHVHQDRANIRHACVYDVEMTCDEATRNQQEHDGDQLQI